MEQLQEVMEADYEIGSAIKERLIPHAISWFTGEAVDMDMDDDEDDDEDDDDEDDDDDEAGGIPKVRDPHPHPPLPSPPLPAHQAQSKPCNAAQLTSRAAASADGSSLHFVSRVFRTRVRSLLSASSSEVLLEREQEREPPLGVRMVWQPPMQRGGKCLSHRSLSLSHSVLWMLAGSSS